MNLSDLSRLSNKWEPKIDISKGIESPIEILNDNLFSVILSYLNFADRIRIERVSKKWRRMSQQSWNQVFKFEISYEAWGIIPIHDNGDCDMDCSDASNNLNDPQKKIFCSKVIKKILRLSANTLTHCAIDIIGYFDAFFNLSEKTISEIFRSCSNLKLLRIIECFCLDFPMRSFYSLRTGKLEEFYFMGDSKETVKTTCFREIFKKSPCLHTISIQHEPIGPEELEKIVNKDALKSLILRSDSDHNCEDMVGFVQCLTKFKNLENFEGLPRELTDDMLKILIDNCKKLKSICLEGSTLTDECLIHLKSLPNLEHLRLLECSCLSGKNLHYLPNLKSLCCSYTPSIEDEGIIKLLNLSQSLEKLLLIRTGVTMDFFKAANAAMKKRTNGRSLEIRFKGSLTMATRHSRATSIPIPRLKNISPLLKIVRIR